MQLPVAVGEAECPETLLLDRGRLVAAQNELQRLSLTAAALLIAAQLLAMKRLPPGTASPENRRRACIQGSGLRWLVGGCHGACQVRQRLDGLQPTAVALPAWHDQRLQYAATGQCTRNGGWPPIPWPGSAAPPLVCVDRRAQQLYPFAHPPFRPRCRFYGAVRDRFSALLAQPDVSMPALVAQLDVLLQVRPHPAAECTGVEHVQSGGVVITDSCESHTSS